MRRSAISFWSFLMLAGVILLALFSALAPGTLAATAAGDSGKPGLAGLDLAHADTGTPGSLVTATAAASAAPQELHAFVEVPAGPLTQPYVILSAYDAISGASAAIEINGSINGNPFHCAGSPCTLNIAGSSILVFRATSASGTSSNEIQATIREVIGDGGSYLSIDAINQAFLFTDSCANQWNIHASNQRWADFPQIPSRLNTNKDLYYLARELINHGIVDTRACPNGGMNGSLPNACGVEAARSELIRWQNQYDYSIWTAAQTYGIPPRMMKTLIEIESQFWPSNNRAYVDEIGLGQANQLGMDVLLRQNPDVYRQVCSTLFTECFTPFGQLPPGAQAMLRGALLYSFNADCPTCEYGVDLNKANETIAPLAMLMEANCSQVDWVLKSYDVITGYEDAWKFTLVSYHSGIGCLLEGFDVTHDRNMPLTWENVSNNFACLGAKEYVDRFWVSLNSFDNYVLPPNGGAVPFAASVVLPPSPTPVPTPVLANTQMFVSVFYDKNGNGVLNETEGLDSISVEVRLEDGTLLSGRTNHGYIIFDMRSFPVGMKGVVSLPGLYRETPFTLPRQGILPIVYIFNQPVLPTVLP